MGLFDFFGLKRAKEIQMYQSGQKTDFKLALDQIENTLYLKLKPLGFSKAGRTFNRRLDNGIIQVINFQSGQHQVGIDHNMPGMRESFYGKFVVNLGVCVESLYKLQYPDEKKKYYKEYECQIRQRLGRLLNKGDYWWVMTNSNEKITAEILSGLEIDGARWFSGVETTEKIIENIGRPPYVSSPRAMLDRALIVWFENKFEGSNLFRKYFKSIDASLVGHKQHVENLASSLGIEL